MDGGLVLVLCEVPVETVVAGVQPPTHEPFPERRIARVESGLPVLVPVEQVGVLLEALWKVVEGEAFEDLLVGQVRLPDEARGRVDVVLFLPMDRDLRLGHAGRLLFCHCVLTPQRGWTQGRTCYEFRVPQALGDSTQHLGRSQGSPDPMPGRTRDCALSGRSTRRRFSHGVGSRRPAPRLHRVTFGPDRGAALEATFSGSVDLGPHHAPRRSQATAHSNPRPAPDAPRGSLRSESPRALRRSALRTRRRPPRRGRARGRAWSPWG